MLKFNFGSAAVRLAVVFALGVSLAIFSGCGTGATVASPKPATSPLNGNWWITGDLPEFLANFATEKFGIAATFDVVDNTIYATASSFYPCENTAVGGNLGLGPATLASDGSFMLQSGTGGLVDSTVQINIAGKAPPAAGQSWNGSYTGTNSNAGCSPVAGNFTATPIASFSGTFAGTGSMGPMDTSLAKQVALTLSLTQGGATSLDPPAAPGTINSVNALTATVSVSGSPCFTSGTTGGVHSGVAGNQFVLLFTMDDGSTMRLNGYAAEPTVSSVTIGSAIVSGGSCDKWAGLVKTVLAKQ